MSDSLRRCGRWPTRLLCPWDSRQGYGSGSLRLPDPGRFPGGYPSCRRFPHLEVRYDNHWPYRSVCVISQFESPNPHSSYQRLSHTFGNARTNQSVQSLSRVRLFATPWTAARQASLSIINSQSLLKLMSIESVIPSNHLILCRPLFFLPSIPPSIRVFSNESALHIRWPKYWSFSFNISPSMNIQGWSPLGWTGWISLQSKGLSRVFSSTTVQKHQFFSASFLYSPTLTSLHGHWKNHSLDQTDLCWQRNVSAF